MTFDLSPEHARKMVQDRVAAMTPAEFHGYQFPDPPATGFQPVNPAGWLRGYRLFVNGKQVGSWGVPLMDHMVAKPGCWRCRWGPRWLRRRHMDKMARPCPG